MGAMLVLLVLALLGGAVWFASSDDVVSRVMAAAFAVVIVAITSLAVTKRTHRAGTIESVVGDRVSIATDGDAAVYRMEPGSVRVGDSVIIECEPQWWVAPKWCEVVR